MKKFNAIILVMAFLLQSLMSVSVFAADKTWEITYHGTANTDRNAYFASVSETNVYTGSKGLTIKYPATYNAENYVEIKHTLASSLASGKYTLSFYNYRDASKYVQVLVGNDVILGFKATSVDATQQMDKGTTDENGWTKYSATFDYVAGSGDFVSFRIFASTSLEAIDEISLTKEGSTANLVSDGGFEDYEDDEPIISDEQEYDTTDYQAASLLASPRAGALTLNWLNPKTSDLKSVKLYDITGGTETLLSDTLSATPGERVYHDITGLKNGTKYQYKVVFSYNTKNSRTYYIYGTPNGWTDIYFGEWRLAKVTNDTDKHVPGEIMLDREVFHGESGASIKYISNIDRTKSNYARNTFFYMRETIPVEPSTEYEVSMWIKTDRMVNGVQFKHNWTPFTRSWDSEFVGTNDWKQIKYTFTTGDDQTSCELQLNVENPCVALWIDDVVFRKANDENAVNLAVNGDFENIDTVSSKVGDFRSVTAEAGYNEATIKIGAPTADYAGAKIYQKVFDEFEYRGTIAPNISEFVINGLDGEKEYTYKLVPFNDNYANGNAVSVSVTPMVRDYAFGDVTLKKNGTPIDKLDGSGSYNLTVSAKNNKIDDGLKYEQFIALYNGDKLIDVFSTEKTVAKKHALASYTKTTTVFDVPSEAGEYRLKVFIIDAREKFNLYVEPIEF